MRLTALIAASLLLAAPAFAEPAPPACTGTDLVEAMRRDKPADYAKLVEATRRMPNAEGLLFRIEKPGVEPSHLFGTMHSTDDRLIGFSPEVSAALKASRTVALELDEIALEPAEMQAKMGEQFAARGLDPDGKGLDGFTSSDRDYVVKALTERGLAGVPPENLRPWVLLVFLSTPACEMARSAAGLSVVDSRVAKLGAEAGAEIVGLESVEEQIDALASIRPEVAVRLVGGMARLGVSLDDMFETLVGLYRRRQIGLLFGDLALAGIGDRETESFAEFMKILVDRRNLTMRDRSLPLIDRGGAFIAVGALHLVGEQGLVELFRQKGYTVTRVW